MESGGATAELTPEAARPSPSPIEGCVFSLVRIFGAVVLKQSSVLVLIAIAVSISDRAKYVYLCVLTPLMTLCFLLTLDASYFPL